MALDPTIKSAITEVIARSLPFTNSPMRAGRVSFVNARTWTWKFVRPWPGVLRDVQPGLIIHPVNQAVTEYRIGSGDSGRERQGVSDFSRGLRNRDVDHAKTVAIPGIEHEILED